MRKLAIEGSQRQPVRLKAVNLTNRLKSKDVIGEIDTLNLFVRDGIRYVRDIRNVETLHHADTILQLKAGDCDDKAILLCALLLSIGIPCRFVALDQGKGFVHVWSEAMASGKWISCDPTEPIATGKTVPLKQTDRLVLWPVA